MAEEGSSEIRSALARLLTACNAGDAAAATQIALLDWRVLDAGAPVRSGEQQSRLAELFAAGLRTDLHWRLLYIRVYGDVAIASGHIDGWVRLPDGRLLEGSWPYHRVWTRRRGAWQMEAHDSMGADRDGGLPLLEPGATGG